MIHHPLLGCAIGDALGKPFETKPYGHPAILRWDGVSYLPGDYPNLPKPYQDTGELLNRPGVPTDDTQMSRILARAMMLGDGSALNWYIEWLLGNSPVGVPRGMGGTIRRSLVAHSEGGIPENCDPNLRCGSGAVMRAGVLGMLDHSWEVVLRKAMEDAELTHPGHPESGISAAVMALSVWYARRYPDPESWELPKFLLDIFTPKYGHTATVWALRLVDSFTRYGNHLDIPVSKYLIDDAVGLTASTVLLSSISACYSRGVYAAIHMGGDTDTRAAMVGTILGTRFGLGGERGILERWVPGLYEADAIIAEDKALNKRLRA